MGVMSMGGDESGQCVNDTLTTTTTTTTTTTPTTTTTKACDKKDNEYSVNINIYG